MSLRKLPRITPAILAANRRNAQKSTGPRTARGRAMASLNALEQMTNEITNDPGMLFRINKNAAMRLLFSFGKRGIQKLEVRIWKKGKHEPRRRKKIFESQRVTLVESTKASKKVEERRIFQKS